MVMKERIRECLSALKPSTITNGYIRQAAILMPVFEHELQSHFLLTLRTDEVETHKGQISFPGGMREGQEELVDTALRETFEEVGIGSDRIEILGRFHDYVSITHFRVTPFVAFLHQPFTINPQVREVAEVLHVPFETFLDPNRLRIEKNTYSDKEIDVYFYSHGAHQIWGLTARIIKDFFDTLQSHHSKAEHGLSTHRDF
jgi:8-oxo-dGTP pyrophosphatase MutT (NUDIX family)